MHRKTLSLSDSSGRINSALPPCSAPSGSDSQKLAPGRDRTVNYRRRHSRRGNHPLLRTAQQRIPRCGVTVETGTSPDRAAQMHQQCYTWFGGVCREGSPNAEECIFGGWVSFGPLEPCRVIHSLAEATARSSVSRVGEELSVHQIRRLAAWTVSSMQTRALWAGGVVQKLPAPRAD